MTRITIIAFTILSLQVFSQQRIQNFYVFAAGNSVGVRFTLTKGSQCSGYTIYHSTDSLNFIPVYNYPGVCGDVNTNQDFSYTHTGPAINQLNYYKVEVFPVEVTSVQRIYVSDHPLASMLVYPNPVLHTSDLLNIKVYNVSNTRLTGFILNQYGKPVKYLDLTTKAELTSAPVYDLDNGLYVLWLSDGLNVFSSKFVIGR